MRALWCAFAFAFVFGSAAVIDAQSLTYEAGYFAPGVNTSTGAPIQIVPLVVTCNQTFTITTNPPKSTNPSKAEWDDPVNATKACRATLDTSTVLASQPVGLDYQFGLRGADSVGTRSAWTVVPFDLRRPVVAPSGLRIGT